MKVLTRKDRVFWFEIEDAEVCIRPLSADEVEKIRRKHTKVKFVGGELREETRWTRVTQELFAACVVDWKNVFNEDGEPLPCNEQNKRMVAELNSGFASEVIKRATSIDQYLNSEELKNSGPGQSGSSEAV